MISNKQDLTKQTPLIISAVRFEVEPLLSSLENEKIIYEYFPIGIGPIHAAHKLSELNEICHNRKVLYIGTCGSFSAFTEPYLIQAEKTLWMPTGVRTGLSHAVEKWYPAINFSSNKKLKLPSKTILTSPELSLTNNICEKWNFLSKEDLYENMELYAVAEALKKSKTLNIILAVTNQVGPKGHTQWKTYFKEAAKMTSTYIYAKKDLLL